jgi:hypothetical protein
MEASDNLLREAIHCWRKEQATKKFGMAHVRMLGSKVLMLDQTVDRIVDVVHVGGMLESKADLHHETRWNWCQELGDSLLTVIRTHAPLPPVRQAEVALTALPRQRQPERCRACGELGHQSESLIYFWVLWTLTHILNLRQQQ